MQHTLNIDYITIIFDAIAIGISLAIAKYYLFYHKAKVAFQYIYAILLLVLASQELSDICLIISGKQDDLFYTELKLLTDPVAVLVACILTMSLLLQNHGVRFFLRQTAYIMVLPAVCTVAYILSPKDWITILMYIYTLIVVVWFAGRLPAWIRRYNHQLSNAYASTENKSFRWFLYMIVILLFWGGCFLVGTAYSDSWGRMLYALSDMIFIFAANHFLIKQEPVDAFVMQSMSNDEPIEANGQVVSEVPEIIDNSKLEQTLQKHVLQQELFLKHDLSIDDVAREIGTNIKYLSFFLNNFKKTNFNQYINDLRLDYAIKLMEKHPEMTLVNVYIRSGFNTASTFSRVFRDRYGMSPSEYAEKLKNANQPEEETTLVASKQQLMLVLEGENSINEFYIQFAQYYPNFLNQLKRQVSNLSPKEFVLCAMVYCEIDNALQAKTLGITRESLRVTKSRINTKLNPNREHPTLLHALRAMG